MQEKKLLNHILLFFIVNLFGALSAQQLTLAEYQKKYNGHNAIFLKQKIETSITLSRKNKIEIQSEELEEMMILKEAGLGYGHKSLYSDSFIDSKIIEAYTLSPHEGKFKKVEATDITTKSDMGQYSFYDDRKATSINFSTLSPGAVTHVVSQTSYKEPRFFGAEFFTSYIPVEEMSYTVKCSNKIKLSYKLFNTEKYNVAFSKVEKGKNTIYTWTVKNMKEYKYEGDAPNIRYYAPHIILHIAEYNKKDSVKNVLSNPTDLYNWYKEITKSVNKEKNEHIQQIVDSLVKGAPTELDKVKRIYYWVQDNIKYIAFEDGLGGFVPREASSVCEKRFGDCKDMAATTSYMLGLAGIKSYMTWIGTRDIPYTYNEVPTSQSDNHMIATYIGVDGKYYFLDATGKNARLGLHTAMIQGKEALIGKGESGFEIVKVPEIAKEENYYIDTSKIEIQENKIKGTGSLSINGYPKISIDTRIKQHTYEDQMKFMKSYLEKGNNKFKVDTFTVSNQNEKEKATNVTFKFSVEDYMLENGEEKYINLNLDKSEIFQIINTEQRDYPKEFNNKKIEKSVVILSIPAGYKCTYLPPAAEFKNDKFGFSLNYKINNNTVTLEKKFFVDLLLLTPENFKEWNSMLKELNKAYQETIVLKKDKNEKK